MSQGCFLYLREWRCDDLSLHIITCSVPHLHPAQCTLPSPPKKTHTKQNKASSRPIRNLFWLVIKRTFAFLLSLVILFIHKYLLSTYCVPGNVLDSGLQMKMMSCSFPWHSLQFGSWRFDKKKDNYGDTWGCMKMYCGSLGALSRAT